MSGVRLRHDVFRAQTFVVELEDEYPGGGYICPECNTGKRPGEDLTIHMRKAVHLRLGPDGDVVVSREIYDQLLQRNLLETCGLTATNEVMRPPTQFLGAVDLPNHEIVTARFGQGADSPFWVASRTRHEFSFPTLEVSRG